MTAMFRRRKPRWGEQVVLSWAWPASPNQRELGLRWRDVLASFLHYSVAFRRRLPTPPHNLQELGMTSGGPDALEAAGFLEHKCSATHQQQDDTEQRQRQTKSLKSSTRNTSHLLRLRGAAEQREVEDLGEEHACSSGAPRTALLYFCSNFGVFCSACGEELRLRWHYPVESSRAGGGSVSRE